MRTAILTLLFVTSALAADTAQPSRPSPPLTIERLGAPSVELSQYRGKVVALAFIFTTCSHCQDLTRILSVIQKDYAAKNVQVVGVAFEEGVTCLMAQKSYLEKRQVRWDPVTRKIV